MDKLKKFLQKWLSFATQREMELNFDSMRDWMWEMRFEVEKQRKRIEELERKATLHHDKIHQLIKNGHELVDEVVALRKDIVSYSLVAINNYSELAVEVSDLKKARKKVKKKKVSK